MQDSNPARQFVAGLFIRAIYNIRGFRKLTRPEVDHEAMIATSAIKVQTRFLFFR
jgi:hypothetical protein